MTQIETERDMKTTMRTVLRRSGFALLGKNNKSYDPFDAYQAGLISKSLLVALLAAELYDEGYRKEGAAS